MDNLKRPVDVLQVSAQSLAVAYMSLFREFTIRTVLISSPMRSLTYIKIRSNEYREYLPNNSLIFVRFST